MFMPEIDWRRQLQAGQVIPACPLMLLEDGRWSQRHQRAVVRYYAAAGAGGLAVGVHSTQFAIRDPQHALLERVLSLVAEELHSATDSTPNQQPLVRIAGVCGEREQAIAEARLATRLGYQAGLLSLTAVSRRSEEEILEHCRRIAGEIAIIGFYLQPAVGGRVYSFNFWRRFCQIEQVVAIKIAPFNRYQTLDVVRAAAQSQRDDIALYTGNDDNIIIDLLTPFDFGGVRRYIVGGLLGQWAVGTRQAVQMLQQIKQVRQAEQIPALWLSRAAALTDANAVLFDAANGFAGCIAGIMETLRRQQLAPSRRCLDPKETLSPGQAEQLDRVANDYPWLSDDDFIANNLHRWLS
jgi:dihydrodipicolinate synthase/N-acetylneuraminate lyase